MSCFLILAQLSATSFLAFFNIIFSFHQFIPHCVLSSHVCWHWRQLHSLMVPLPHLCLHLDLMGVEAMLFCCCIPFNGGGLHACRVSLAHHCSVFCKVLSKETITGLDSVQFRSGLCHAQQLKAPCSAGVPCANCTLCHFAKMSCLMEVRS